MLRLKYPYIESIIFNATRKGLGDALGNSAYVKENEWLPDVIKERILGSLSRRLGNKAEQTDVEALLWADTRDELTGASRDLGLLAASWGNASVLKGEIIEAKDTDPDFQELFFGKLFHLRTIYRFR